MGWLSFLLLALRLLIWTGTLISVSDGEVWLSEAYYKQWVDNAAIEVAYLADAFVYRGI